MAFATKILLGLSFPGFASQARSCRGIRHCWGTLVWVEITRGTTVGFRRGWGNEFRIVGLVASFATTDIQRAMLGARKEIAYFTSNTPQPATRNPQPATRSPQPAARSPQPAARSPQPATRSSCACYRIINYCRG